MSSEYLQVAQYDFDKCLVSIKDTAGDIDIGDGKWDRLFGFISEHTTHCYFSGFHLNYDDGELRQTVNYLAQQTPLEMKRGFTHVFFEVKPTSYLVSRRLLAGLFDYYEQPCLVFVKNIALLREQLSAFCKGTFTPNSVRQFMQEDGLYCVYRSFEQDVLWIRTSEDLPGVEL